MKYSESFHVFLYCTDNLYFARFLSILYDEMSSETFHEISEKFQKL